jgi:hypothetical protein
LHVFALADPSYAVKLVKLFTGANESFMGFYGRPGCSDLLKISREPLAKASVVSKFQVLTASEKKGLSVCGCSGK